MKQFKVIAPELNLRSSAKVHATNRMAVLPYGQVVVKLGEVMDGRWVKVLTKLNGTEFTGFVAGRFLNEINDEQENQIDFIRHVHLQQEKRNVTRKNLNGYAFPLGEENRPQRDLTNSDTKVKSLLDIIEWLDVENSFRYKPGANTYCNIYAFDYCYLAGVYLPRVWWSGTALENLARGIPVIPQYATTVKELSANDLYNWLSEYQEEFRWQRVSSTGELQEAVNQGLVGLISAHNISSNASGHISVVAPEHEGWKSTQNNGLLIPLQSQAGRQNRKFFNDQAWWLQKKFKRFGFWIHE